MFFFLFTARQLRLEQDETLITVIDSILQSEEFEIDKTTIQKGFCQLAIETDGLSICLYGSSVVFVPEERVSLVL